MGQQEIIKQIKHLLAFATFAILGFLVAWIYKPNTDNSEEIKLKTEIIELQYNNKVQEIENDYLRKFHFIENADPAQLDSLWASFDF